MVFIKFNTKIFSPISNHPSQHHFITPYEFLPFFFYKFLPFFVIWLSDQLVMQHSPQPSLQSTQTLPLGPIDQIIQDLNQKIDQLQDDTEEKRIMEVSFIARYNAQTQLCDKLQHTCDSLYKLYTDSAGLEGIDGQMHQERRSLIDEHRGGIEVWAQNEEDMLIEQIDSIYIPNGYSLGQPSGAKIEFRKSAENGNSYAVKFSELKPDQPGDDPIHEAWFVFFTSKDQHPSLLNLILSCTFREQFVLITPKAKGYSSLMAYMTHRLVEVKKRAIELLKKICCIIDYLHNHLCIAHLDIKPENIFLDGNNDPILGDFGMARTVNVTKSIGNKLQKLKFHHANQMTTLIRQIPANHYIDDTQDNIVPKFSVCLDDFIKYNTGLSTVKMNGVEGDLYQYIDHISIVALSASTTELSINNEHTGIVSLPDPPVTGPEERFFFLDDYIIDKCDQEAAAAGSDYDTYSTTFDFDPCLYAKEFYHHTINNLQQEYNQALLMGHVHVQVGFAVNLPAELYSYLTPDLSTLKITPISEPRGTPSYMAPEVLGIYHEIKNQRNQKNQTIRKNQKNQKNQNKITSYDAYKADIYSLGVLFYFMFFGFRPYNKPDTVDDDYYYRLDCFSRAPLKPNQIRNKGITLLLDELDIKDVDPNVSALLDGMMDFNPTTRLTIKQIINDYLPKL